MTKMSKSDFNESIRALRMLAQTLGNNAHEQIVLQRMIDNEIAATRNRLDVIQSIIGNFYDGLAYGNWPKDMDRE